MFMGQWRDKTGTLHYAGMADCLVTPKVGCCAIALWVECKAGTGKLRAEQKAFQEDVEDAGAFYLVCYDSADALIEWFKVYGVVRG
jgi:hypothetical protein